MNRQQADDWRCYPEVEKFIDETLSQFMADWPFIRALQQNLLLKTSTRLQDWIDHLVFTASDDLIRQLQNFGFQLENVPTSAAQQIYHHPKAIFPRIILEKSNNKSPSYLSGIALITENITLFLNAVGVSTEIEGSPLSLYRRAVISEQGNRKLWAVERRGYQDFVPQELGRDFADQLLRGYERWMTRTRQYEDKLAGMDHTLKLAQNLADMLGENLAAWTAFKAERDYWMMRNRAGRVQFMRQNSLGLGWANHDHHTFRCSREAFPKLLQTLKVFGFQPREKFYAGSEAGWGAQVLEQPACRLVVFADVDLSAEELSLDFEKVNLPERKEKGTVGFWCSIHGESLLEAGLHHLAALFSFPDLQRDLEKERILFLTAFSHFPYLKQAFTIGERWKPDKNKLTSLFRQNLIDSLQMESYSREGIIGSHLENIQRSEGFKGFNQQSVSDIIRRTDPRVDFGAA